MWKNSELFLGGCIVNESDSFDLDRLEGHRPMGELVYTAIRQAILRDVLRPGQRLVTEDLAARMGVSRTPVREAIRRLEVDGLVKKEPWKSVVVAELPPMKEMEEFYFLRGAVEGVVAYFAARRRPMKKLEELRAVLGKMEEASVSDDTRLFMDLQADFWDRYIALASSKRICQVASGIRDSLERAKPISILRPRRMQENVRELRAVLDAIDAGDSARAEALAREHCRLACEAYRDVAENRGRGAAALEHR